MLRTAVSTTASYLILVFLLRIAGPRVLAKWYAFDLIVTVALGVLHWSPMRAIVNSNPTLVLLHGEFQDEPMRRQRVAEADIRVAVRQHGIAAFEDVGAVILEAGGTFSIIRKIAERQSALADVSELGGSNKVNKAK